MAFTETPTNNNLLNLSPELAYFRRRTAEMGLNTASLIDAHGIQFCPTERLNVYGIYSKQYIQNRPAILFPYIDATGKKLDAYHARMIGDPPEFDAPPKGMTREAYAKILKSQYPKYLSSRHVDAYFPIFNGNWDEQPTIFITEGMPKAIRACQAGIPCISIQGKDMFKVKGTNLLVPSLEAAVREFTSWKSIVYIADSDAHRNEDIRGAGMRFMHMLNSRRQSSDFAKFAILPDLPGIDKTGLDDYLNLRSADELFRFLPNWLQKCSGGPFFELVEKLGNELAWIEGTTNYFDMERRDVIQKGAAALKVRPLLAAAGTIEHPATGQSIPGKALTLENTFHATHDFNKCSGANYWPGMPDRLPDDKFNMWHDCSPDTVEGDITPLLKLYAHTVPDEHERELHLQLLAHRILYPQEKAPLIIFLHGGEGTGKTCCATAFFAAITSNPDYIHIGGLNLAYGHEDRHIKKQAVCLEDPTKSGMTNADMESIFKQLGDGEDIHCNPKGVQGFKVKNRMLLWVNANNAVAPVSGAARRWLVLQSSDRGNPELAKACWEWMHRTPNFGGIIRHYLLQRFPFVDSGELQQKAALLESKQELLEDNKSQWTLEFETFMDELPNGLRELKIIPTRLMMLMPPYADKKTGEIQSFTRQLSRDYPLVSLTTSKEKKVQFGDYTSSFRSMEKGAKFTMTVAELKEIYKRWEDTVFKKGKF